MQEEPNITESIQLSHPVYQRADEKDADACAWVFSSAIKFEKYFYKHPELGPNEVRGRNLFASLCMSDVHTGRGLWGECTYPLAPGHEVVAEVIAVGSEVKNISVGDTVMFGPLRDSCNNCDYCKLGSTHLCFNLEGTDKYLYGLYWGGYSTHIQQPASHCYLLPKGINPRTAAPLMCSGVTVHSPLAKHTKKGDRVGVIGTGGLGHMCVQFAAKLGLEVDAFSFSNDSEKNKLLMSFGASKIVEWKDDNNLKKLDMQYDVLINTIPVGVTSDKMDLLLGTLKPRGKLVLLALPALEQKLIASYFSVILKELQVIGSVIGGRKETAEMLVFAAEHNIEPICEFFEFDEFDRALQHIEHGTPKFKCLVNIDETSKKFIK